MRQQNLNNIMFGLWQKILSYIFSFICFWIFRGFVEFVSTLVYDEVARRYVYSVFQAHSATESKDCENCEYLVDYFKAIEDDWGCVVIICRYLEYWYLFLMDQPIFVFGLILIITFVMHKKLWSKSKTNINAEKLNLNNYT